MQRRGMFLAKLFPTEPSCAVREADREAKEHPAALLVYIKEIRDFILL